VFLDDHCQAQNLSNNLPGSYEMEQIFHSGSVFPLKIRAGFYTGEGYSTWLFLVFQCPSLRVLPSCIGTSKHGRTEGSALLLYIKYICSK
jgi:hypothetical protein